MSKELVNMANDYIEKCYGVPYSESIALQPVNHKDVHTAFIYAYEHGYKEGYNDGNNAVNKELKAQIEKMKCCENCKNFYFDENKVKYRCRNKTVKNFKKDCNLDKWELSE